MSAQLEHHPDPKEVLAKALFNASRQLGLNQAEVGAIIGLHRSGVTRLKKAMSLDPASKHGEIALYLIRSARALYALSGGDQDWIRHFMRSPNRLTGGIPAEQLQTVEGLIRVMHYLDAVRGKL
ncbi:MbcA/ParS/Xre antitoxin family protein [Motiliproteus sp. MSK22-1]|uniref:MbcA/ParS/Xre antitoxin family protein n=1 Tax=Motiliproteus sp. MSK22-1 TaxID=1897630 RepID=UPI0009762C3C|nr:MbcA/ParS/Xre antitoxin family protein [Motiliproteus sp. MSK22-1]OMH29057.1 hypothetical protein BGP75_20080 [Motiliproteus sp. MSK22-1]